MNTFKIIPLILVILLTLSGCGEEEFNRERIEQQKQELASLEVELTELENKVVETRFEKGLEKYILTLNIRQRHFTFDMEQHMKDEMNTIKLQIPVDKEYYDSLKVGDTIDDSFRMGSFVLKGSFGSWNITIADKAIK